MKCIRRSVIALRDNTAELDLYKEKEGGRQPTCFLGKSYLCARRGCLLECRAGIKKHEDGLEISGGKGL